MSQVDNISSKHFRETHEITLLHCLALFIKSYVRKGKGQVNLADPDKAIKIITPQNTS